MTDIAMPRAVLCQLKDAGEVVLDSERWLRTPNDQLGGREPIDLINSPAECDHQLVRDLIDAIKHGFFS